MLRTAAAFVSLWLASASVGAGAEMRLELYPPAPLIERARLGQALNFDIEVVNSGEQTLELTAIRAAVRDPAGRIVQRLEINDNGSAPGIATIPTRSWRPGEAHTLFNPFHTLANDVPVGRIDYELVFRDENGAVATERIAVRPSAYVQKTPLVLPMRGRVLVWDGHDFYSHHRRWDFSNPAIKRMGLLTNPARYSLDLVTANADGAFRSGSGAAREDYFGYGAEVVAPGAGTVVALFDDASNEPADFTAEAFARDPMMAIYGNYVVIDHGNGEFSQLGHLKQGSVKVAVGERVRQGQPIAEVGASGTSLFPHLHYQLTTRPDTGGEGLPARFHGLSRVLGSTMKREALIAIDSGDIVEAGE